MLLQFNFSNYKSFSENTVLDMRASSIRELNSHVREQGSDKVLPLAVIYGPNASGKSKFFEAFEFMSRYVIHSLSMSEDNKEGKISLAVTPFAFSERRNEPSTFEVDFVMQEAGRSTYYNYGFSLDAVGIVEEWLYTNTKTGVIRNEEYRLVFQRLRGKDIKYGNDLKKYQENINLSIEEKVLIVTLGSKLRAGILRKVRDWFYNNEVIDFSDPISELINHTLPRDIVVDKTVKGSVIKYLNSFDDAIVNLEFRKSLTDEDSQRYTIFSHHLSQDGSQQNLSFDEESAGTIKMFILYQMIIDVLSEGSILFADELDTKLHPLLMRNIILTFTDPKTNPNNAQLIFTTHNVVYLDMDLLRRDEIWFTEKNDGMSELYSLDDVTDAMGNKIRSDADYVKNYLIGSYGATPDLSALLRVSELNDGASE